MYICILIYTIISILYNIYIYNYAPLYIDCVYTVGSLCIPYRLFTSIKIIYIPFGWSTCYGSHGHLPSMIHRIFKSWFPVANCSATRGYPMT